jgi:hypothetical protein
MKPRLPDLFAAFILGASVLLAAAARAQCPGVPWPATDALGRKLPTSEEVGPPRPGRFVAIFYFLWHCRWGDGTHQPRQGPYDIGKILAADADALHKPASPLWGPYGFPHYWGEPLFGYYRGDDPWVLRKHAELLADAGVDTLIFDATNAETYPEVYLKLCQVFADVRKCGGRTPQIAFMVNTKSGETAARIYRELYQPGLYRDLWFPWQGKPLLVCDPAQAGPEVKRFFTLRRPHWPFAMVNTPYAWHWEATYPQPYGFTDDPARAEQVNVSVAQNLRVADGQATCMSRGDGRGRGFHDGRQDPSPAALARGANFAEQWRRVGQLQPSLVMVTGWNEWYAGRFPGQGVSTFVDQFDEQFSRDVEPMRGGHGDNFYYQMIDGIRRYKGVPPLPAVDPKPIRIDGRFDDWQAVRTEFADDVGDVEHRNHPGMGSVGPYADGTGRNDLAAAKVSWDHENVYFYIRTRAPISPHTDPAWMLLFIDADCNPSTGWLGYDFVVNCTNVRPGVTTLERCRGGYRWGQPADVPYHVAGNELELAIPRSLLGLSGRSAAIDFKWADNIRQTGDAADFLLHGDAAPNARFNYRVRLGGR